MPTISKLAKQTYLISSANQPLDISDNWFEPAFWQNQNAITGQSVGRNTTYFFAHQQQNYVLRHYYRGGLIGKFANDGYFYTGLKRSRVYCEFALLEKMQQLGLPVPTPIAARLIRTLHLYSADIVMTQIPNASDVFHILQKQALDNQVWQTIGKTIAQFHQAGVFHADLNIHNIMLDNQGKVWIIDFDRGRFKTPDKSWQQNNLNRLLVSLKKEKNKQAQFYWQDDNWQALLTGYQII
ncbi:3-deoxy-D-manno-octulosonic acid kinase [Catenovulum sp. 2E275]|uniref:3-deoxy-D-manno-octulosonic acid kinase n=1 Tax=Catenovulum sp. 2E275 TaxID=2980497 RepID=UPI0021D2863A|nr:3-deoxy-D-manno-octulosonic acid kinase [Catenovulum sp. 2E275]MCU4674224.1 3-deoxy-D-manno-octulosonic acid kinase [Catenovulum sp. 2E275]